MITDLPKAAEIAVQAAKNAADRILRGYNEELDIAVKSDPADRVTQVDHEAQDAIAAVLQQAYPDVPILGEEDTDTMEEAEEYWVVDPLDGTSNFIQRLPHVGVSIALRQRNTSVVGVLHFPVYNDIYTAVKGGGAFRNAKPIHVRERSSLGESVVSEIFSDRASRGNMVGYPPSLAYRKFGSAVTSLAYLAQGSVDATALQCHLWDIAAGEVLIQEAGGKVQWEFADSKNLRSSLTFVAATPGIFDAFSQLAHAEYSRRKGA